MTTNQRLIVRNDSTPAWSMDDLNYGLESHTLSLTKYFREEAAIGVDVL